VKIGLIAVVSIVCVLCIYQKAQADTLALPQYGFQIDPLDTQASAVTTQALITFLPPSNGFAPNVNVQIQPYEKSMKEYIALSKKQFDQEGWKIISENMQGDSEWVVEYSGSYKGSALLHWYARVILNANTKKVYLATATAKEDDWNKVSPVLKKCADSFKIN
jgi:hypothetical protein